MPLERSVVDARILRDRQIWAQRQFLEDAAHAERLRHGDAVVLALDAFHQDAPLAERHGQSAGQHMHQRRLAGPVMSDKADKLADADVKSRRQRAHARRRS